MKKKSISLIMLIVLLLSLIGCSNDKQKNNPKKTEEFIGNAVLFIKINPSFEIEAENGIVSDLIPKNEDAEKIIVNIEYKGLTVSETVKNISDAAVDAGYLNNDGKVIYGVIDSNLNDENLEKALDSVVDGVQKMNEERSMSVNPLEGCPVCWGTGVCEHCEETPGSEECMGCHGKGVRECHECNGSGKDEKTPCTCGGSGECYRCKGTGKFEDKTCDVCHGDGKCLNCNGLGTRKCDICNGKGTEECDVCHGSGLEECSQCHGSTVCKACNGDGLHHY